MEEVKTRGPTNVLGTADDSPAAAEQRRVDAVKALDLFGEPAELAYDDAVYLASLICGTPISLVTVLEDAQRFRAKIGISASETPKDESFCIHAIQQQGLFVVPDARLDSRFRDLPLVTHGPKLRFYAGMPLSTIQGDAVGALCVCDVVPRELSEEQKTALTILSRQVAARFHDREKMAQMAEIIREKERMEQEVERYHSELRTANERLRELSLTDPLTGCWNRRSFDERLTQALAASERDGGDLSVLMLDIDNFKRVNDTYGHEIGDKVLCHVARVLKEGARGTDVVCRYGGEEFAILLPRTTKEGALFIAERLRLAVDSRWEGCPVTVSVGIGSHSPDLRDPAAVTRLADEALYEAKAAGKNRVVMAACKEASTVRAGLVHPRVAIR